MIKVFRLRFVYVLGLLFVSLPLFISCHSVKSSLLSKISIKDTLFIGPNREVKSLQDFFADVDYGEVHNLYIIVEEGNYNTDRELWVRGEQLIVEGRGEVNLFCTKENENVMWVTGDHIVIRNFRMKHLIPGSTEYNNCTGRVLVFDVASNVLVEDCDLNGCGLAGLHDNTGNSNILIRNNYIHNNSVGAYTDIAGGVWQEAVKNHEVFTFENNQIENNGPDRVLESDSVDDK